jgi:hypothetical protein
VPSAIGTHRVLKDKLGDAGGHVAPEAVLLALRRTVHGVVAFAQLVQQPRHLLGRMLEIVVHRDGDVVAGQAHAAKERVVLAVVP